ncbi:HAD hydrolase-like protein [Deltaproteobacteria bacterium]|nr:HAD hydrolase-like protein [Deltaproteobacteria bacterium]|tara:strand:+ start:213 stop:884 length:672 start_codon:yes stop_codon:yes gene_type:complete
MTLKAVFFGSIGSFSETSRLQLESFNESMKINQINEIWDEKEYIEYLKISGGINRLKSILPKQMDVNILQKVHYDKTQIFQQKILKSRSLIRPGFEQLCEELLTNNILLGIASTTSLQTIENILLGLKSIEISDFNFIAHSETVNKQKPDPQVYKICLEELNVQESESVAFEDTTSSLNSVLSAGIKGIAIPGNLSLNQDFSKAQIRLNEFSEIDFKGLQELF